MAITIKKLVPILLVTAIAGCASTYVPKPGSIDPVIIPEIRDNQTVTLINAQPSSEIIQIGSAGMGRSLEADYQQWTDRAIKVMVKVFKKKGIGVSDGSPKVLKLAITDAQFVSAAAGWGFECTVNLNAETGEGEKFDFVGQRKDWKYVGSCNKAFTEVVSKLLSDENIQGYLSK